MMHSLAIQLLSTKLVIVYPRCRSIWMVYGDFVTKVTLQWMPAKHNLPLHVLFC